MRLEQISSAPSGLGLVPRPRRPLPVREMREMRPPISESQAHKGGTRSLLSRDLPGTHTSHRRRTQPLFAPEPPLWPVQEVQSHHGPKAAGEAFGCGLWDWKFRPRDGKIPWLGGDGPGHQPECRQLRQEKVRFRSLCGRTTRGVLPRPALRCGYSLGRYRTSPRSQGKPGRDRSYIANGRPPGSWSVQCR